MSKKISHDICYYWYFLNKGFKFQTYVCNRCHNLLMMPMSIFKCLYNMPSLLVLTLKVLIIAALLSVLLALAKYRP